MEKLRTETYNNWNKNTLDAINHRMGRRKESVSVKTEQERLPNLKSIEKMNPKKPKKNQQKDKPSTTYESITKDLCH